MSRRYGYPLPLHALLLHTMTQRHPSCSPHAHPPSCILSLTPTAHSFSFLFLPPFLFPFLMASFIPTIIHGLGWYRRSYPASLLYLYFVPCAHTHCLSLSLSKAPHSDVLVLYHPVQSGGAARAAARYSVSSISQYTIVLMCTCCSCARGIRPWRHKGTPEFNQSLPTCLLTVPRKRE